MEESLVANVRALLTIAATDFWHLKWGLFVHLFIYFCRVSGGSHTFVASPSPRDHPAELQPQHRLSCDSGPDTKGKRYC